MAKTKLESLKEHRLLKSLLNILIQSWTALGAFIFFQLLVAPSVSHIDFLMSLMFLFLASRTFSRGAKNKNIKKKTTNNFDITNKKK